MNPARSETALAVISNAIELAGEHRHRQLILLSGDESECCTVARPIVSLPVLGSRRVWLGRGESHDFTSIHHTTFHTVLGDEFDAVVVNTFDGFECDAVAALEGTLVAGGVMILITPPLSEWPAMADPAGLRVSAYRDEVNSAEEPHPQLGMFTLRLTAVLRNSTECLIEQNNCTVRAFKAASHSNKETSADSGGLSQAQVIDQFCALTNQNALHSITLIADRGRGKSAALGIAAARILTQSDMQIIVSAPGKRSASVLFRHFRAELLAQQETQAEIRCRFLPPDQLNGAGCKNTLLIVDEAASIPLPLLLSAASNFNSAIFASTVKGYEGAGRGFALRFAYLLEQNNLQHTQLTLQQPIRWAEHDPLEALFNKMLLLDSPLLPLSVTTAQTKRAIPVVKPLTPEVLTRDEQRLRTFYGLLLQAHYKTTPNDLRHLLDGHNMRNFALEIEGQLVGAATIATEGPIKNLQLRQAIIKKLRRPHGHLLPQLLSQYTCIAAALDLRVARVVRIAIHPHCHRQGLGSEFLSAMTHRLKNSNYDAVGAMFSAVPETVNFWKKNSFVECHLGARKQTSSGYRAITLLQACTSNARDVIQKAHCLYADTHLSDASTSSVDASLGLDASAYDPFILQRFGAAERSFRDSQAALARMATDLTGSRNGSLPIDYRDRQLVAQLCTRDIPLQQLVTDNEFDSKKEVEHKIRAIVNWYLASH